MQIKDFISKLNSAPNSMNFSDVMKVVETNYHYIPTAFTNGKLFNRAGENEGSCKLFAFAKLQGFNQLQTLSCFGAYYRDEVLNNPDGDSHQNIRNFMQTGWDEIKFEKNPLIPK